MTRQTSITPDQRAPRLREGPETNQDSTGAEKVCFLTLSPKCLAILCRKRILSAAEQWGRDPAEEGLERGVVAAGRHVDVGGGGVGRSGAEGKTLTIADSTEETERDSRFDSFDSRQGSRLGGKERALDNGQLLGTQRMYSGT